MTEEELLIRNFVEVRPGVFMRRKQTPDPVTPKQPQQGRLETTLERALYDWLLTESRAGRIAGFMMQPEPLRLAHRCTYRPDATCIRNGRREYYEAKGRYLKVKYEDGWVKLKVAANMFRDEADFYLFERQGAGGASLTQVPPIGATHKERKMKREEEKE